MATRKTQEQFNDEMHRALVAVLKVLVARGYPGAKADLREVRAMHRAYKKYRGAMR
jgi:hypothetical protein